MIGFFNKRNNERITQLTLERDRFKDENALLKNELELVKAQLDCVLMLKSEFTKRSENL